SCASRCFALSVVILLWYYVIFFFSSRRRHTRSKRDWSSDVCSSDLVHDNGLEVRHVEDLREHYALTLKSWCENLEANWDACLDEVTLGRAKIWGVYM